MLTLAIDLARGTALALQARLQSASTPPDVVDRSLDQQFSPVVTGDVTARRRLGTVIGAVVDRCLPGRSTCWTRAVTQRAALLGLGVDAHVRIGVRRQGGQIESHAWVETAHARIGYDPSYQPVEKVGSP